MQNLLKTIAMVNIVSPSDYW